MHAITAADLVLANVLVRGSLLCRLAIRTIDCRLVSRPCVGELHRLSLLGL